jgi:ureidoacrylate peracid hydrolase
VTFEADLTALLVVDPYNDFISEGGKLWPNVKEIAEAVNFVSNMRDVLHAAREAGLRVIFVPHHCWRENDIAGRKYLAPIQRRGYERRISEATWWGGESHGDFRPSAGELLAQEHRCSSRFANTYLDLRLKQQGIHKLIVIGLRAKTCIDSVRFAAELVKDAIASYHRGDDSDTRIERTELRDRYSFRRRSQFSAVNKQLRSENVSAQRFIDERYDS